LFVDLKNSSSPGADIILAKVFKFGGLKLVKLIHGIIDEVVPKVYSVGTIHTIGDHGDC